MRNRYNDFLYIFILLISAVVFVHIIPALKPIFFIVSLILFFNSKKDYIWIAFIFIFMQMPGGLFTSPYNYFIRLTSTVGISYIYAFSMIALIKWFVKYRYQKNYYLFKEIKIIIVYIIFLILLSILFGIETKTFAILFFVFCSIALFVTLPSFFHNNVELKKLINVFYYSLIILSFWQFFDLISPTKIYMIANVGSTVVLDKINYGGVGREILRMFYAPLLSLIVIFSALYYLLERNTYEFNRNYLLLMVFLAFMNIFLTATRGYILQYIIIIFSFGILSSKHVLKLSLHFAVFSIIVFFTFPSLTNQILGVSERLLTLEELYQGDVTAAGTLVRITERAPRVWNQYINSPIFGYGYSRTALEYNDDHVGNYTLLLQGGIVGVLIYIFVLFSIVVKIKTGVSDKISRNKYYFFMSLIMSLIFAHSTSSTFFSYFLEPHITLTSGLILLFIQREYLKR